MDQGTTPLRIGYADPPYPGQARKHYGCAEVDHGQLIARLARDYPDGWALSTSSPALRGVLAVCPPGVRVAAWVKPFASFKPGVNPAYAWEPVVFAGGRKRGRADPTVRDWVSCNAALGRGLAGAKPDGFCLWLFGLMGLRTGDTLDDLFPGTGAVTRAWRAFAGLPDPAGPEGEPEQFATLVPGSAGDEPS